MMRPEGGYDESTNPGVGEFETISVRGLTFASRQTRQILTDRRASTRASTDSEVIDEVFHSSSDPTGIHLEPVVTGWPANGLGEQGLTIEGKWDYDLLSIEPPQVTEITPADYLA